jgi:hypothetical protein
MIATGHILYSPNSLRAFRISSIPRGSCLVRTDELKVLSSVEDDRVVLVIRFTIAENRIARKQLASGAKKSGGIAMGPLI